MNPLSNIYTELEHICESAKVIAEMTERSYITLERINGRLDRLELWMAQQAGYPTAQAAIPDLAALRASSGIEE